MESETCVLDLKGCLGMEPTEGNQVKVCRQKQKKSGLGAMRRRTGKIYKGWENNFD
jgi:hypothetical protein